MAEKLWWPKGAKVLALDPATVITGYAHSCGLYGLTSFDGPTPTTLKMLYKWLHDFLNDHPADLLAYERWQVGGKVARAMLFNYYLRGVAELVAAERDMAVVGYYPSAVKKYATGDGRADKQAMIDSAAQRLGVKTTNDNVADALWILNMARNSVKP